MITLRPITFGQEFRRVAPEGRPPSGTINNSLFSGADAITLSPQTLQRHPLFAGDANKIFESYKAQQATNKTLSEEEAAFKAICDVVVWTNPDVDNPGREDTLTVGDMAAHLSRIRPKDNYPGYGTVEEIAGHIPGLDINKLKEGFYKLFEREPMYLGYSFPTDKFWLRTTGEEILQNIYPNISLPPKKERFTLYRVDPTTSER